MLVPSRDNPDDALRLLKKLKTTSAGRTDVIFYLQKDQIDKYSLDIPYITGKAVSYGEAINTLYATFPNYRLYLFGNDNIEFNMINESVIFNLFDMLEDIAFCSRYKGDAPIISKKMIEIMGQPLPCFSQPFCWDWLHNIGLDSKRLFYVTSLAMELVYKSRSTQHKAYWAYNESISRTEEFLYEAWRDAKRDQVIKGIKSAISLSGEGNIPRTRNVFRSLEHPRKQFY